jgi:hypothetical protein
VGTGDVQEALDTVDTQALGGGGGALAVGSDQIGDVVLIEAIAQVSTDAARSVSGHMGLVNAMVWQSRRSAACTECESHYVEQAAV